jgi:hypothetical protein
VKKIIIPVTNQESLLFEYKSKDLEFKFIGEPAWNNRKDIYSQYEEIVDFINAIGNKDSVILFFTSILPYGELIYFRYKKMEIDTKNKKLVLQSKHLEIVSDEDLSPSYQYEVVLDYNHTKDKIQFIIQALIINVVQGRKKRMFVFEVKVPMQPFSWIPALLQILEDDMIPSYDAMEI